MNICSNLHTTRIRQLDVLRALAMLLVLFRHIGIGDANHGLNALALYLHRATFGADGACILIFSALYRSAWMGVDLFFVLSGFLVSGLLFREYSSLSTMRPGRFLLRRAFKIYPPFYILLVSTVIVIVITKVHKLSIEAVLSECFFVQNYGPNIWGHTWSLAIEEHFYLLLAVLLPWMGRRHILHKLPYVFIFVALAALGARWATSLLSSGFDLKRDVFATHLRLDALFYGVVLSYGWHFHQARLLSFCCPHRRVLLFLVSIVMIFPAFVLERDIFFMRVFGLSFLSLGFSGVILWSLTSSADSGHPASRIVRVTNSILSVIGVHSYSIYLWHAPFVVVVLPVLTQWLSHVANWKLGCMSEFLIYVVGSLMIGILSAKLIEFPSLRLRDRLLSS